MQIRDFFQVNMLLEVYDHDSGIYYKSLLQEVNGRDIAIGIPMKDRKRLVLQEGTGYLFRALLEDAVYYFHSNVRGRKKSDRVSLYLIDWPDHLERRQRRRFFRLAYTFNVDYWVLEEDVPLDTFNKKQKVQGPETEGLKIVAPEKWGGDWEKETAALYRQVEAYKPCPAVATNLSGGGLMLVARHRLPLGATLVLHFFLQSSIKKKKEMLVKGKIARILPLKKGEVRHYRYGVEFWGISERTRDEIIRFIFLMLRQRLS